jgi:membrane protein DedA with SNARE-associated domain
MAFQTMANAVAELVRQHQWLVDPIAFALGFFESIVFSAWLVPANVMLLALGGIHGAAGGNLVTLWAGASLGAIAGDLVSYAIGRYGKPYLVRCWPLSHHPDWLPRGHAFIETWGIAGIILGKFTGPLRSLIPLASGAMEMRWPKFVVASVVSSMIWAAVLLSPGFLAAHVP